MSKIQVFVSFDTEHDAELYKLLLAQSRSASATFDVSGCSEKLTGAEVWSESVRGQMSEADQVIVICGEHTKTSPGVKAELRIAQQEGIPYFLLWGRRENMCTKPVGAKRAEAMYSWTSRILRDQLSIPSRKAAADAKAEAIRNAARRT